MDNTNRPDRLTQLCDEAVGRLERAADLLKRIKAGDQSFPSPAVQLAAMCRHVAYEGSVLAVPVDAILAELQEIAADEVFGPRGEDQTAGPGKAAAS
jgi:hypothetical protein